mgnify:CR=1 FL=1
MNKFPDIEYRPCVGIMIINQEGYIFTGQRLGYASTAWQMPQGGIEKDEDEVTAAYRELEEETSIKRSSVELLAVSDSWMYYELPVDLVPKLWGGRYKGQKQKWFLMRFEGLEADINLATETPEFSSWRWSTQEQLVSSIVSFKKPLYKALLREFNSLL